MKINRALTPILLLLAGLAHAQQCRVLDPELQAEYEGPCANGLAQGTGYARGRAEYRGEFGAGMKHGEGVKSWPNGDRYEGQFVADRKEGQGTYTYGRGPWAGAVLTARTTRKTRTARTRSGSVPRWWSRTG